MLTNFQTGSKNILGDCQRLDFFYIPTRYPNGLPEQVPYEALRESIASKALTALNKVYAAIDGYLPFHHSDKQLKPEPDDQLNRKE